MIEEIIDYLNSVAKSDYTIDNPKNISGLNQLIKEGYSIDDFKLVIDKKWSDWENTEWQKYVRPETLFGGNFKRYLNEQPRITKSGLFRLANAVNQAKQTDWKLDNK
jgi:uncharacterized phage protein (TIGR02220 family)